VDQPLSEQEKLTLKTGAFGAVFLVSNADPGLLSMIKESFAASDVIAGTSGLVKVVLTAGPLPKLPTGSARAVEAEVLPALRESVRILRTKAPAELEPYREVVLKAVDRVARAHGGVHAAESAMIEKVTEALSA
jgi:hypothetical protein